MSLIIRIFITYDTNSRHVPQNIVDVSIIYVVEIWLWMEFHYEIWTHTSLFGYYETSIYPVIGQL